MAFLFGLVHGLGFAGALKDVGLPQNHLPTRCSRSTSVSRSGSCMTVAAAWLGVAGADAAWPWFERARTPALYGIGSVAAYWSWLRVAAIFS